MALTKFRRGKLLRLFLTRTEKWIFRRLQWLPPMHQVHKKSTNQIRCPPGVAQVAG